MMLCLGSVYSLREIPCCVRDSNFGKMQDAQELPNTKTLCLKLL